MASCLGWNLRLLGSEVSAFFFGEEQKKFSAFVGSPTAGEIHEEYDTNYSSAKENSFLPG